MLGRSLLSVLTQSGFHQLDHRLNQNGGLPTSPRRKPKYLLPVVDRRLCSLLGVPIFPYSSSCSNFCFHVGVGQLDFLVVIQGLIEAETLQEVAKGQAGLRGGADLAPVRPIRFALQI